MPFSHLLHGFLTVKLGLLSWKWPHWLHHSQISATFGEITSLSRFHCVLLFSLWSGECRILIIRKVTETIETYLHFFNPWSEWINIYPILKKQFMVLHDLIRYIFWESAVTNTRFFYKQRFFSTQHQCCLTFSWIELQMLLKCCFIYLTIILRHILHLVYSWNYNTSSSNM